MRSFHHGKPASPASRSGTSVCVFSGGTSHAGVWGRPCISLNADPWSWAGWLAFDPPPHPLACRRADIISWALICPQKDSRTLGSLSRCEDMVVVVGSGRGLEGIRESWERTLPKSDSFQRLGRTCSGEEGALGMRVRCCSPGQPGLGDTLSRFIAILGVGTRGSHQASPGRPSASLY